jgi:hypothetical protein
MGGVVIKNIHPKTRCLGKYHNQVYCAYARLKLFIEGNNTRSNKNNNSSYLSLVITICRRKTNISNKKNLSSSTVLIPRYKNLIRRTDTSANSNAEFTAHELVRNFLSEQMVIVVIKKSSFGHQTPNPLLACER